MRRVSGARRVGPAAFDPYSPRARTKSRVVWAGTVCPATPACQASRGSLWAEWLEFPEL
jgi:hypothetical protein